MAQRKLSAASFHWYMRDKQRGTVSSNSRFQTVLFQQCSANLSLASRPLVLPRACAAGRRRRRGPQGVRVGDLGGGMGSGCEKEGVDPNPFCAAGRRRFPASRAGPRSLRTPERGQTVRRPVLVLVLVLLLVIQYQYLYTVRCCYGQC